jgi:hypothetical protein
MTADPTDPADAPVIDTGQITSATVDGDVSGTIAATGAGTIGQLVISGNLLAGGQIIASDPNPAVGTIDDLEIGGTVFGTVNAPTLQSLVVGGAVAPTAQITAGTLSTMTVGLTNPTGTVHDMAGALSVGTLGSLTVAGGTPGSIVATNSVGSIGAFGGFGPVVLQVTEKGIQRRVEVATPGNPYPQPNPNTVDVLPSPAGSAVLTDVPTALFQYLYESSGSLPVANPQLTVRVTNTSAAADQFDLSLVVYNDTAKFNLARLDSAGVAGIRDVDVEGDILTSVSPAAQAFTGTPASPDTTAAGIRLTSDALAGVGVRDTIPSGGYVQAKSIEALSFGSFTQSGQSVLGSSAGAGDAAGLLGPNTQIVPANDTFRVPFADLPTQQVGFFMDDTPGGGSFDGNKVVFTVQSDVTANLAVPGSNTVTPSNVARGAATALVRVAQAQANAPSVINEIDVRGDGASIQTQQWVNGPITSTGPLGDLTLLASQGVASITAPSIFGTITPGGPVAGPITTTGQWTDPITGLPSTANPIATAGDFGRIFYPSGSTQPTTTALVVKSGPFTGQINVAGRMLTALTFNNGFSGSITAMGDIGAVSGSTLLSPIVVNGPTNGQIATGGSIDSAMTFNGGAGPGASIAAVGNIGAFSTSGTTTTRIGGLVVNGHFQGELVALGDLIGDVTITNGLQSGQIGVKGSSISGGILGNLTIKGGIDAGSTIASGGVIGSPSSKTTLTVTGGISGIVAAKGAINFSSGPPRGSTTIFNNTATTDPISAAAIDAVFSTGQSVFPTNLSQVLAQLTRLRIITVKGKNELTDS